MALNTNKIGHHVLRYTWHIVESVVKTPIKLVTMFYVIPDTLFKVALNTNKIGHHVLRYTWHIVESVAEHQ